MKKLILISIIFLSVHSTTPQRIERGPLLEYPLEDLSTKIDILNYKVIKLKHLINTYEDHKSTY
jgi:hypothetical protein